MLGFMKCVVEAVTAKGVAGLLGLVPGGQYAYDLGGDALKRYRDKNAKKKLEDEVKELIAAKADVALAAAKQAVEEVAPHLSLREKELVTQYVASIPEAARQSMKRKDDPSGQSLPFGYTIHTAEDVAKVLPQYPPRFVSGDVVPGLSSWRLVERLGGGGFGEVWLARHEWKSDLCAVKFCTDPVARNRLITHEKDLIVRVMKHAGEHPSIVPLLECNLAGEAPWLMYEYVPGSTLADLMLDWQKLPPAERLKKAVATLHPLAAAVGHCHRIDPPIVHRDLKPANVLMSGDTPRITDFGIGSTAVDFLVAEETRGFRSMTGRLPTILSGSYSLLYASPQQRSGERPDPRDDVHALGVIAYQMLTGDLSATPGRDADDDLRDAGTPDDLISLIGKSVSQKADRRPKDATEWERELSARLPRVTGSAEVAAPASVVRVISPASPVVTHSAATPTIWLSVPGTWWAEEKAVCVTPADVVLDPKKTYRLRVAKSAFDLNLNGLAALREFSGLHTLSLGHCTNITNAGLEHLTALSSLRVLDLDSTWVRDAGLQYLSALTNLQDLCLNHTWVTDEGVKHLTTLANLRVLNLDRSYVRFAGMLPRSVFPSLQDLRLNNTSVTDVSLQHLSVLSSLQCLSLNSCNYVTDAAMKNLTTLSKLQSLSLNSCKYVTDAGMEQLAKLTTLRVLSLERTWVRDAGLEHLSSLSNLHELSLNNTWVTDRGLQYISALSTLRVLSLDNSWVTDLGLKHLSSLSNLECLSLNSCNSVTDEGLEELTTLSRLRHISLNSCKYVTDAGIVTLQLALPNCCVECIGR
jgi:serine/threonine protein kinase